MKRFGLIAIFLIYSNMLYADVPAEFSFQGILKDTTGSPVDDGIYAIKFSIYNDSIAGIPLWETAGFVPIQTAKGLFQHILGSTNLIPDSIARSDNLWVGVKVNLEPEMLPRTKLTSVPFSFSAQYADTATISLDKTINAGDLILGVLDTARFSAYQDLLSENMIGTGTDQVAAGNHVHTGVSFPGTMYRIEDTTTVEHYLPPNGLVKTLSVPGGLVSDFFRISFTIECAYGVNNGLVAVSPSINGQYLTNNITYGINGGKTSCILTGIRLVNNRWLIIYDYYGAGSRFNNLDEITLAPSSGLTLNISTYNNYEQGGMIRMGVIFIEYDVD